ncbi:unnamed protein product, partial [Amoebophrya sp. A25]|eukprot:GSA25T00014141001.1
MPVFLLGSGQENDGAFKHIEIARRFWYLEGGPQEPSETMYTAVAAGEIYLACSSDEASGGALGLVDLQDMSAANRGARPLSGTDPAKEDSKRCSIEGIDYQTGHYRASKASLLDTAIPMLIIHLNVAKYQALLACGQREEADKMSNQLLIDVDRPDADAETGEQLRANVKNYFTDDGVLRIPPENKRNFVHGEGVSV